MGALSYEYMLRKVYNCGRNDAFGANHLIYGKMEDAYEACQSTLRVDKKNQIAYAENFSIVRAHVYKALYALILLEQNKLSIQDRLIVESYLKKLTPEFYDKQLLDCILDHIADMLNEYGTQE